MKSDPRIKTTAGQMAGSISRNGVKIVGDVVRRRQILVDNKEYERRMAICKDCLMLRSDNRCAECGCLVTIKAKFKAGVCPLGKYED